jgi:hypothetical protein
MGVSTDAILFYGWLIPEDEQPWEDEPPWDSKSPCGVGYHCSNDYPMYYIHHQDLHIVARRGYPESLGGLPEITDEQVDQLYAFAKKLDWTPDTPLSWHLVSMWG